MITVQRSSAYSHNFSRLKSGQSTFEYLRMNGKMNEPPLRRSRLLLIAPNHVFRSAEEVARDAVTDSPASGPIRVILDRELFRLIASFT